MTEEPLKELKKDSKKLSYINNLWLYFEEIKNRFLCNRDKIKTIIKIYNKKISLDKKYTSEIKALCNKYYEKYKKDNIITPSEMAINKLIDVFKEEIIIFEEQINYIKSELIKSLNGLIEGQISVSNEMIKLMESSLIDFKLINQLLRERETNLMKIGKEFESTMYKIERIKMKYENKNLDKSEKIFNKTGEEQKHKQEKNENNSKDDIFLSLKKEKEVIVKKAKVIQYEYESFISIANDEREKYINITAQIYNQFQLLDEQFVQKIKESFKNLIEKEIDFLKQYTEIKSNFLGKYINIINVEEDINSFINSKKVKFKIPPEIGCLYYTPQIVLKNRNDPIESKITEKVNNEINSLFLKNKKKESKEESNIFNFINTCIKFISQEKEYDKEQLLKLLEKTEYRKKFFFALNQYRIEGIFELQKKTFNELSFLFNNLISFAILDEDYDSIKSIIILSQTFYLGKNKELFLNACIENNKIWKEKLLWENLIDFSINEELNNPKDFYMFLDENSKSREQRINSTITSSIITFIFNMKLFDYPEEKYKELIDDLVEKYKIDGTSIYATLNSINIVIEKENNDSNKNKIDYGILKKEENINHNKGSEFGENKEIKEKFESDEINKDKENNINDNNNIGEEPENMNNNLWDI